MGQDSDLWEFQGKGGYQVMSQNGYVPENMCNNGIPCTQAVFSYDSAGRIIGDSPLYEWEIEFYRTLFGTTLFYFAPVGQVGINAAPWNYSESWLVETTMTIIGWFSGPMDVANDLTSISTPLFPLSVQAIRSDYWGWTLSNQPNWLTLPEEFR